MRPLRQRSPVVVISVIAAIGMAACAAPPSPARPAPSPTPTSPAPGSGAARAPTGPAAASAEPEDVATAPRAEEQIAVDAPRPAAQIAAESTRSTAQIAVDAPRPGAPIVAESTRPTAQIAADAPRPATQIAAAPPGSGVMIAGVVVGADGRPAAGAYVELSGDRPGRACCLQDSTTADAGGRFHFEQEPAGARLGLWARSRDGAQAAIADVTGRGVYRLVLEPAVSLEIKLGRAPGASAPPAERFADVYAIRVATRAGVLRTRMAASAGGLSLPGVLPGAYTIEVEAWCEIGPPCAGAIARGQIRPGGPAVVALRVQRYGAAEGVAIDPATGQPIAGAPITCDDGPCVWDVNGFWRELRTGPDGRYRITGLAPGLHELRFGERPPVAAVVKPGP